MVFFLHAFEFGGSLDYQKGYIVDLNSLKKIYFDAVQFFSDLYKSSQNYFLVSIQFEV